MGKGKVGYQRRPAATTSQSRNPKEAANQVTAAVPAVTTVDVLNQKRKTTFSIQRRRTKLLLRTTLQNPGVGRGDLLSLTVLAGELLDLKINRSPLVTI